MPRPLENRTAVVTGSSSGIGQATALALAEAGAAVVIHACTSAEGAEQTRSLCQAMGAPTEVIMADLTDPAEQARLINSAWQWRGGVDVWVNNAGADVLTGSAAKLSFQEKLQLLWQLDGLASVGLTREVGRRMIAAANEQPQHEPGRYAIINMGWDQAITGMEGDSGEMFAMVKGAVMAFTKSAAKSLAPHVRVNCVAPGWIRTAWGEEASDYWKQRATAEAMLGRWGTPADVATTIAWLASPAASFVTGQIININGGYRGSAS